MKHVKKKQIEKQQYHGGRGRDRDEDVGSGNNGNDEKKKMEWFGVGLQEKGGGVVREMKSERLGLKL